MKSIENPDEIKFYRMGGADIVIIVSPKHTESSFNALYNPTWSDFEEGDETLTLDAIFQQVNEVYGDSLILVIAEYPLSGKIYRYGNYKGGGWIEVGTIDGYA